MTYPYNIIYAIYFIYNLFVCLITAKKLAH